EEHYPYGETSFGGYARKRYRYSGKERDEESGLTYHGARYCSSSTCRWICCDPLGVADSLNLYEMVRSGPIRSVDRTGMATGDADVNGVANVKPAVQPQLRADPVAGYTGGKTERSTYDEDLALVRKQEVDNIRGAQAEYDRQFLALYERESHVP